MDAEQFIRRLVDATNAHDLDGIAACFTDDYVNETPVHPARGFHGSTQVRANWEGILGGIPDIAVEVSHHAVNGESVWTEWEMRGNRRDGQPHLMRGVIVFGLDGDQARSGRFYLEPVDAGEGGVAAAIDNIVGAGA